MKVLTSFSNDFLRYHGFQATEADLHKLGLIASGMFQATGYFIANLGDTALLLTVYNSKAPNTTKEDLGAIPDIFPAICNLFPMNQRRAFVEYLAAKGIEYTEEGDTVKAIKNEARIVGSFDEKGRMTKIRSDGIKYFHRRLTLMPFAPLFKWHLKATGKNCPFCE